MIEDARGRIEYDEYGAGPTIVFVPGSCSTGAAWRPVIASLKEFRSVTTSLLGYGKTAERRTAADTSIAHEIDAVEAVIRKAGGGVHLVGHSFGGFVSLAVAMRNQVPLASLTVVEAPAANVLRDNNEREHYSAFRAMTDAYFEDFANGNRQAIATMIDFYGGAGTFASWPARVRDYAIETTPVNILDWASAYGFALPAKVLSAVSIPVLVIHGGASHSAAQRANALLCEGVNGRLAVIDGAAHFMIATHAGEVAQLVRQHVHRANG